MGLITLAVFTLFLLNQVELGYGHNTSKILDQLEFQVYNFVANAWKIFNHRRFEIEQRVKIESLVLGQLIPLLEAGAKEISYDSKNYFFDLIQSVQTQLSSIHEIAMNRIEIYIEAIRSLKTSVYPSTEIILRLQLEQIDLCPPSWGVKFGDRGPLPNDHMTAFILEPEIMEMVIVEIFQIGGMSKLLSRVYKEKEKDESDYKTFFSSNSKFELECDDKTCRKPRDMSKIVASVKDEMGLTIEKLIPYQAKFMHILKKSEDSQKREALKFMNFQKEAQNKIEQLAKQFQAFDQIKLAELLEEFAKKSLTFQYIASDIRIFREI